MKLGFTLLIACVAFVTSNAFGMFQYNFYLNKQPQANSVLGLVPYGTDNAQKTYIFLGGYKVNGQTIYGSLFEAISPEKAKSLADEVNSVNNMTFLISNYYQEGLVLNREIPVTYSYAIGMLRTIIDLFFRKLTDDQFKNMQFFAITPPLGYKDGARQTIAQIAVDDLKYATKVLSPDQSLMSVTLPDGKTYAIERTFWGAVAQFFNFNAEGTSDSVAASLGALGSSLSGLSGAVTSWVANLD